MAEECLVAYKNITTYGYSIAQAKIVQTSTAKLLKTNAEHFCNDTCHCNITHCKTIISKFINKKERLILMEHLRIPFLPSPPSLSLESKCLVLVAPSKFLWHLIEEALGEYIVRLVVNEKEITSYLAQAGIATPPIKKIIMVSVETEVEMMDIIKHIYNDNTRGTWLIRTRYPFSVPANVAQNAGEGLYLPASTVQTIANLALLPTIICKTNVLNDVQYSFQSVINVFMYQLCASI